MRIVVLGGGVVGVTTAYQLQRDGHEVVILERNREVAAEASFGNAGMIAPGHSFVWSSPRAPRSSWRNRSVSERPGPALQVLRRSAALCLVLGVPEGMHGRQGAPQHAAQASSRRLFAVRAAKRRRRGGDRLRPQHARHPLPAPQPAGARRRRRAHEAARIRTGRSSRSSTATRSSRSTRRSPTRGSEIAGAILCPTDETGRLREIHPRARRQDRRARRRDRDRRERRRA